MSISRSGYYKWKYRKENPTLREITRQSDLELIKKVHNKHKAHGYRWINHHIRNLYGVYYTDNDVHRLCKYENIRYQGKHYQWKKPDEEHEKFNNLVWNGWKYLTRPYEVIVSDMTAFWVKSTYYELTMYFDAWNKEILGYGLSSRKGDRRTYYDGLVFKRDIFGYSEISLNVEGINTISWIMGHVDDKIEDQIILHTDQGPVYSSKKYNNLLKEFNIQRSMSRAGTPTDNPVNESLNGWIKEELFIDFDLKHSNDVSNLIKLYIDYYNNERPSYALKYKTPIQYKTESGF